MYVLKHGHPGQAKRLVDSTRYPVHVASALLKRKTQPRQLIYCRLHICMRAQKIIILITNQEYTDVWGVCVCREGTRYKMDNKERE